MSIPQAPKPAKLLISLFTKERSLLEPAAAKLAESFGPIDMVTAWLDFDFTEYYAPEMGRPLFRRVIVFKHLIGQEELAEIKRTTNRIEQQYLNDNRRLINIDPAYLLHERFVLASAKNFTHRIYIGKGIYADLTLIFTRGSFQSLPWTYPDYQDQNMLLILEKVRSKYIWDFKKTELMAIEVVR